MHHVFAHGLVDFNRRASPELRLSYEFLWFCWFSNGFDIFLVDFNRRPSTDLRLSYDSLLLCMFFLCFAMFLVDLIVGRRKIFGSPMISIGFVWFSHVFG